MELQRFAQHWLGRSGALVLFTRTALLLFLTIAAGGLNGCGTADVGVETIRTPGGEPEGRLVSLAVGPGRLQPGFDPAVMNYDVELDPSVTRLVVWASAGPEGTVWMDGQRVSGPAMAVPLDPGTSRIKLQVRTGPDSPGTYTIEVSRRLPSAYPLVSLDGMPGRINVATMEHDGLPRRFLYYLPRGFDPDALHPVIVGLHGFNHPVDNLAQMTYGSMQTLADGDGAILVFPESTGSLPDETYSWNPLYAGEMAIRPDLGDVDDVGFLTTLIDVMVGELHGDPDRIYVTGTSMGGAMTYALGTLAAGKLAAIAPVIMQIGTLFQDLFADAPPIPTMIITGTEDPLVSPDGMPDNSSIPALSQAANLEYWKERNGITGPGRETRLPNPVLERFEGEPVDSWVLRIDWSGPSGADLVYLNVVRGGHWLPAATGRAIDPATDMGGFDGRYLGVWNNDVDAAAAIYDFFMSHSR